VEKTHCSLSPDQGDQSLSKFDQRICLTFAALRTMLAAMECQPVVCYILSSFIPVSENSFVRIANNGDTEIGYDIVCHPAQLPELQAAAAGMAVLTPRGNTPWRGRVEKMLEGWHLAVV